MLEDEAYDAELILAELTASLEYQINSLRVETKNDFLKQILLFNPDLILSDYRLPQYNGLRALEDLIATGIDIPFIIVTGSLNEETAADSIKAGAWDYVVKERLFRLPSAVKNALALKEEQNKKKLVEQQVMILSNAIEHAPVSIVITDKEGIIEYVNPGFEKLTLFSKEEAIGRTPQILKSDIHDRAFYDQLWETILQGKNWTGIFQNKNKKGDFYFGKASISSLSNTKGEITNFIGIEQDITDHMNSENALKESEERFQLLSDATFESLFIMSNDVCINQNKSAEKLFGYKLDEVLNKPFGFWIKKSFWESAEFNLTSNKEATFESVALKKDGTSFPCNIRSSLMNHKGEELRVIALWDITQQKFAENALRKSEKKYRELIENQGEGIILANTNEIISFANPAAEQIFGVKKDGLIGKSFSEFTTEENFQKLLIETQSRKPGTKSNYEIDIIRKDKIKRTVLVTGTPRYDDDGKEIGSFGIFRDITERIQILSELEKAKIKAEESDKLKTVFLQNMSHEVRTPMNGIIGFAEMLNDPELTPTKQKNYTDIIINNSKQLLMIIQDIITISSLETRQFKVNRIHTSINDILFELQTLHNANAKQRNINLFCKKGLKDSQAMIYSDPIKLREVLDNLIGNAFKFTTQGTVEIGYVKKENELEFYVKDTGIGIHQDMHLKIFNRFWQVDQGTTRIYGGTGLGLAISKGYVDLMGGKIWVESDLGKGAVFYFTIPYDPIEKTPIYEPNIFSQNAEWQNKTILVAEDEEINFIFLEELLTRTGARVLHAKNGQEAVEYVNSYTIDLILMDIKMPVMDGYQASREIRKVKPDLPIIAQTAYVNSEDRDKAKAAGCNDFLTKPITLSKLLGMIKVYLDK